MNNGCSSALTTLNSATSITNDECFDVEYTMAGNESTNGIYVMCKTGNLSGASSCLRLLIYGNKMGFRAGSCNENGNNTVFAFLMEGSNNNPQPAGKKFELEGIVPSVYTGINPSDYLNYDCRPNNDWSNGAVHTQECNGPTIITMKPNVSVPSSALFNGNANIECKLKPGDSNW